MWRPQCNFETPSRIRAVCGARVHISSNQDVRNCCDGLPPSIGPASAEAETLQVWRRMLADAVSDCSNAGSERAPLASTATSPPHGRGMQWRGRKTACATLRHVFLTVSSLAPINIVKYHSISQSLSRIRN